jgi:hypothetical protein
MGVIDASCETPLPHELTFDVEYEQADVAFLVDNTHSMLPVTTAFESELASLAAELVAVIPDLTLGYALFEDYRTDLAFNNRPFRLRHQQTDDFGRLVSVIAAGFGNIPGGYDWEEASIEALRQAATGVGHDLNCDGYYDGDYDVQPFVSSPTDAFYGTAAGAYDPSVPGSSTGGGMGLRSNTLPIFVLATDAMMKDPELGHSSPDGCPSDATLYSALTAVGALGGKFVGIEVLSGGETSPWAQMTTLATATNSYGDMDGDYIDEPAVIQWDTSASSEDFREKVRDAILALAEGAWFDKVHLEATDDPQNLIVEISPEAYFDIQAGQEISFELEIDGNVVPVSSPTTSEVELSLIADDTIVLAKRTLFVEP